MVKDGPTGPRKGSAMQKRILCSIFGAIVVNGASAQVPEGYTEFGQVVQTGSADDNTRVVQPGNMVNAGVARTLDRFDQAFGRPDIIEELEDLTPRQIALISSIDIIFDGLNDAIAALFAAYLIREGETPETPRTESTAATSTDDSTNDDQADDDTAARSRKRSGRTSVFMPGSLPAGAAGKDGWR